MTDHPVTTPEPWPDWLADLTPEDRVREIVSLHAHWCHGADGRCSGSEAVDLLLRLLDEARQQAPVPPADLASLRERIDAALGESMDRCSRCKVCDAQLDAIMAVLAAESPREPPGGNPVAEVPSEPVMELLEYASDLIGAANEDGSLGGAAVDRWRDRYRALVAEYAAAKAGRSPEPKAEPAPPLPAGDHGRMELPGFRSHTGWWTPGVLAGQAVMVCSDRDGNPVAEYIPGPASRFVRLPVPTVAASEARALGWSGDDDDDPDDYAVHVPGCRREDCDGACSYGRPF